MIALAALLACASVEAKPIVDQSPRTIAVDRGEITRFTYPVAESDCESPLRANPQRPEPLGGLSNQDAVWCAIEWDRFRSAVPAPVWAFQVGATDRLEGGALQCATSGCASPRFVLGDVDAPLVAH